MSKVCFQLFQCFDLASTEIFLIKGARIFYHRHSKLAGVDYGSYGFCFG